MYFKSEMNEFALKTLNDLCDIEFIIGLLYICVWFHSFD
jgi:hypothetical protein